MKHLVASRTHPSFVLPNMFHHDTRPYPSFVMLNLFQHNTQLSPVILKQVQDDDICADVFECPVHDNDDVRLAA